MKKLLFITLFLFVSSLFGAKNHIAFHGTLLEPVNKLPKTGEHTFKIELFDTESSSTALWTETHTDITVDDLGKFTLYLGAVTTLDNSVLEGSSDLFIQITVDEETPLPRVKLGSTMLARISEQVGNLREQDIQPIISTGCPEGYYFRYWDTANGEAVCQKDQDTDNNTQLSEETVKTYARSACYDEPSELTNQLNGVYAAIEHNHNDLQPKLVTDCGAGNKIQGFNTDGSPICAEDLNEDTQLDQTTVETYAKGVCYDSVSELTTDLNSTYQPFLNTSCDSGKVLIGFSEGAPVCVDDADTQLSELTVQNYARAVCYDTTIELANALSSTTCSAGHYIQGFASGTAICVADQDTDTQLSQETVEGYAEGVCYNTKAELTDALGLEYVYAGGTGIEVSATNVINVDTGTIPLRSEIYTAKTDVDVNTDIASCTTDSCSASAQCAGVNDIYISGGCEYSNNSGNASDYAVITLNTSYNHTSGVQKASHSCSYKYFGTGSGDWTVTAKIICKAVN